MMQFASINDTLLLIALGIGFVVIYLAKREERPVQFLGFVIGGIIIASAVIYIIGNLGFQYNAACSPALMKERKMMKMMHKRMMGAPIPQQKTETQQK